MNVLLAMFKKELEKIGIDAGSYTKQKLKARLMAHFKERLVFHQSPQQSRPEIVFSSSISLIDIINAASTCPLRDETNSISMDKPKSETFSFLDIYTIASIIRREMLRCEGRILFIVHHMPE